MLSLTSVCFQCLHFSLYSCVCTVVIRYIYDHPHELSPGEMTLLKVCKVICINQSPVLNNFKGAMISNSALAAICVCSGIYNHLVSQARSTHQIDQYAQQLLIEREKQPKGQFWSSVEAPKVGLVVLAQVCPSHLK
jgi:endoribonuclease Dicer